MLMMSLISWQRTFLTEDEKPAARCTGPLGSSGARGDHCRTLPVFKVPRARTVARARVVLRPQSVSVFRTTARRYHQRIRSLEEGGGRRRGVVYAFRGKTNSSPTGVRRSPISPSPGGNRQKLAGECRHQSAQSFVCRDGNRYQAAVVTASSVHLHLLSFYSPSKEEEEGVGEAVTDIPHGTGRATHAANRCV